MKKMGLNKDYITQLTRNLAKVERQHLISLNEIKSRMNMMEKSLKNNFKTWRDFTNQNGIYDAVHCI